MALVYEAGREIIEGVLEKLKEDEGIAQDAHFDYSSLQKRRVEVLPRDLDFLHFAGIRNLETKGPFQHSAEVMDKETVETGLRRLKRNGCVAEDASFNYGAVHKLAEEVLYRDFYFLYYLGLYAENGIAASVLKLLKEKGIVAASASYSPDAFEVLRREVRAHFDVPDTAVSPVMERLLYMLSSLKQPKRIIAIGIFCGNTLAWCVGSSCNGGKVYDAEKIYGIDIDPHAIDMARKNFAQLAGADHIELIAEDGLVSADRLQGPFDYIYLDVDSPESGKRLYPELLQKLYPKLSKGGWVLAHDTVLLSFERQLGGYLNFVRDRSNFSESISFDVDALGLELSIK